jgi:hypothetical protein
VSQIVGSCRSCQLRVAVWLILVPSQGHSFDRFDFACRFELMRVEVALADLSACFEQSSPGREPLSASGSKCSIMGLFECLQTSENEIDRQFKGNLKPRN